jgi:hypothetical protein
MLAGMAELGRALPFLPTTPALARQIHEVVEALVAEASLRNPPTDYEDTDEHEHYSERDHAAWDGGLDSMLGSESGAPPRRPAARSPPSDDETRPVRRRRPSRATEHDRAVPGRWGC